METVNNLEIISNFIELQQILEILEKVGLSSYTIIKDVTGKSDRGKVIDD
ncbi:hypothetical protein [Scytonema sp. PRP1]